MGRAALKFAPTEETQPLDGDAFSEGMADKMASELVNIEEARQLHEVPSGNKALIKKTKVYLADRVSLLARAKDSLQTRIATAETDKRARDDAAKASYEHALAEAKAAYDAEMADVEAELFQISECKEALGLAHDRLMKSEL